MYLTSYFKQGAGRPFSRVLHPQVCSVGNLSTRRGTITGLHSSSVRMLYIVKDLLIIGKHLDLGGSDSDTSRSTLAVGDAATSSLVGDSPHASTSFSVRGLPCSSTSSASDQEQSSLEEFNASTDSGTYPRSFFRETWVQFLLRTDAIQALVVAKYLPKSRLAFPLASVVNVLTLSSLQTLHPMKRRISSKKSPVMPSTSVTCISRNMVSLSGFLNLTWDFLAHTNDEVSASVMLGSSHRMAALTSFSASVSRRDILITLMSCPKAFVAFNLDMEMFLSSVRILRTAI